MIAVDRCFRSKPQRALVNVKMTEMANQIKVGGVYHSQMHSISSDANYLNYFCLLELLFNYIYSMCSSIYCEFFK